MPRTAAFAVALVAVFLAQDGQAQDNPASEADAAPTAEELIEAAREAYRPPGLLRRRCPPGAPGEIVVCAPIDDDSFRVPSSTDDAIAAGEAVSDGIPRAPQLAPPPCDPRSPGCFKFGKPAPMPPMVDFDAIPEPLTSEEAALVFRAEDQPSSEAALPAEAP